MIQYERYATELCIYRDNAESSCNGKCQMMKELNQTESNSPIAPQLPEFKLKEQPLDFFSKLETINLQFINLRTWVDFVSPKLHTGSIKGIFHPPCYLQQFRFINSLLFICCILVWLNTILYEILIVFFHNNDYPFIIQFFFM